MAKLEQMEVNAAREFLQAKLLSALFSRSLRNEIILKGGMALRVASVSERYTKDIDLASPESVSPARIRQQIRQAIAAVRSSGMLAEITVSEPKQTDTILRWKIGGFIGGTQVNLTVEVSRRPGLPMDHVHTVNWVPPSEYSLSPVLIDSIDLEALAFAKLSCLGDPRREAPRDIYDLNLLVMMDITPPMDLLRRVGRETLEQWRSNVWAKLEKMTFEEASSKLLPHLPEATRSRIDEAEWERMRLRVGDRIEAWLDAVEAEESSPRGPGSP